MLNQAGFMLRRNNGDPSGLHESELLASLDPPSNKKTKKWRHGISKEAEKKIAKALELNGAFVKEACIKVNEHVNFYIQTENIYKVQVKREPCCSCTDF